MLKAFRRRGAVRGHRLRKGRRAWGRRRSLFAEGAVAAAEFMIGREPGMYDMNDLIALNA